MGLVGFAEFRSHSRWWKSGGEVVGEVGEVWQKRIWQCLPVFLVEVVLEWVGRSPREVVVGYNRGTPSELPSESLVMEKIINFLPDFFDFHSES